MGASEVIGRECDDGRDEWVGAQAHAVVIVMAIGCGADSELRSTCHLPPASSEVNMTAAIV